MAVIADAEGIRGQLRRAAKQQIDDWLLQLQAAGAPPEK